MNKIIFFFVSIIFLTNCSLNKNSKFWTSTQNISKENISKFKEILVEEKALEKEFNSNLKIKLNGNINNNTAASNYFNNSGKYFFEYDPQSSPADRPQPIQIHAPITYCCFN